MWGVQETMFALDSHCGGPAASGCLTNGFRTCHGSGKLVLCQVPGCMADLQAEPKAYNAKKRICSAHMRADAITWPGCQRLFRFCFQCGKCEPLEMFDGLKRSCRMRLHKRRAHPGPVLAQTSSASDDAAAFHHAGVQPTPLAAAASAALALDVQAAGLHMPAAPGAGLPTSSSATSAGEEQTAAAAAAAAGCAAGQVKDMYDVLVEQLLNGALPLDAVDGGSACPLAPCAATGAAAEPACASPTCSASHLSGCTAAGSALAPPAAPALVPGAASSGLDVRPVVVSAGMQHQALGSAGQLAPLTAAASALQHKSARLQQLRSQLVQLESHLACLRSQLQPHMAYC